MARIAVFLFWLSSLLPTGSSIDNGLGITPPMGWRSANLYGGRMDQQLMMHIMDGMISRKRMVNGVPTSLADLGYQDVGLDDAWQACGQGQDGYHYHDANGRSIVNTTKFPNLADMNDHGHRLGLTVGWYHNNCGCGETKQPTDQMYEQDVLSLANEFHFDGVKLDGCGTQLDLSKWADLINKTGRGVVIENCHWGRTVPTEDWCPWNFFRTSTDIHLTYGSVMSNLQSTVQWARNGLSRPGCWAYPDGLEVGVKKGQKQLTLAETRAHFGAWCIVSSPLILEHDVWDDAIVDEIWPIIANIEAILVNQAWYGHSGSPFKEATSSVELYRPQDNTFTTLEIPEWQFFYKPLNAHKVAVLLMNHGPAEKEFHLEFADIPGLTGLLNYSWMVRDIWQHTNLKQVGAFIDVKVASHDAGFFLIEETSQNVLTA